MKKLSSLLAMGTLLSLSVAVANAQATFTYLGPTPDTVRIGQTFNLGITLVNDPNTMDMPQLLAFGSPGLTFSNIAGSGNVSYSDTGFISQAGGTKYFDGITFTVNSGAPGPHTVTPFVQYNTSSLATSPTFRFTIATPEFGSIFSLGGLLMAGGTGLWVQRRRRKNSTEAN